MAIEVITLSISPEQNIDSCLAFAKGLLARKIASGAVKEGGKVKIFMLPATAARYAHGNPTFLEDRDAVVAAIKAAGYRMADAIGSPNDPPSA